jgi:hypothetical protein
LSGSSLPPISRASLLTIVLVPLISMCVQAGNPVGLLEK